MKTKYDIEKSLIQMRKGNLELCILSIIQRSDAYAPEIIEELKQNEIIVVEGTIYPLLTRLKNNGILEYRWEESSSGPPRKYYTLTSDGKEFLNQLKQAWVQLSQTIQKIIH